MCENMTDILCVLEKIIIAEVNGSIKSVCKPYKCFSWCKLNLMHGNQDSSQDKAQVLLTLSMFLVVKTWPYLE